MLSPRLGLHRQPAGSLPRPQPRRHARPLSIVIFGAAGRTHVRPKHNLPAAQRRADDRVAGRSHVGEAHVEFVVAEERARDERLDRLCGGVREDNVDLGERQPRA
jgi:hypothetical protein